MRPVAPPGARSRAIGSAPSVRDFDASQTLYPGLAVPPIRPRGAGRSSAPRPPTALPAPPPPLASLQRAMRLRRQPAAAAFPLGCPP
eukprot:1231915-Prymnesium_polylepis.1